MDKPWKVHIFNRKDRPEDEKSADRTDLRRKAKKSEKNRYLIKKSELIK